MPKDPLKDYAALRQSLETERAKIIARLQAINAALGSAPAPSAAPTVAAAKPAKVKRGSRAKNELSLKEAIAKATTGKALTKDEIYEAVKKLGYVFTTKKPLNSINAVLYGKKPKFKNVEGKFSAA